MFGSLDIAASGTMLSKTWMDAIADNIANANTVRPAGEEPFRARLVVARRQLSGGRGDGVALEGIEEREGEAARVFDPSNPLADDAGFVTRPVVDMAEEMGNLVIASRSYQANLNVLARARDSYQKALEIGRRS